MAVNVTEKDKRKKLAAKIRQLRRDVRTWRHNTLVMRHAGRYRPGVLHTYPNGNTVLLPPPLEDLSEYETA
jgi:hypothetical protein